MYASIYAKGSWANGSSHTVREVDHQGRGHALTPRAGEGIRIANGSVVFSMQRGEVMDEIAGEGPRLRFLACERMKQQCCGGCLAIRDNMS